MKKNDTVRKIKGYEFEGEVMAVFENSNGDTRVVVEHDDSRKKGVGGMLHIFNPSQLEIIIIS